MSIQTCLFLAVLVLLDYATKYLHLNRFWFAPMLRVMFQLPAYPSPFSSRPTRLCDAINLIYVTIQDEKFKSCIKFAVQCQVQGQLVAYQHLSIKSYAGFSAQSPNYIRSPVFISSLLRK